MALDLQPLDMQVLQKRIREAFSGEDPQEELRGFVTRSLKFDIFDELGGPDTAMTVFATKLIDKTIEDGTTDQLVQTLLQERKGDTELREFVKRVLPDALTLVPQQDYEAAVV